MGREPRVGQQLREPVDRMSRQSLEHILQVGERIAPEPLAAADEAIQDRRRPAAPVTPDEEEVLPTEGLSPQRPLGEVVVDAQLAVAGVRLVIPPLRLGVGDGLAERALFLDILTGQDIENRLLAKATWYVDGEVQVKEEELCPTRYDGP
jgi:hypothetical protein